MYCKHYPYCKYAKHSNYLCKHYFLSCHIYIKLKKIINVNNMDIQELLAKAFDIGNTVKFKVRFYDKHGNYQELFKEMTYTELGMYLIKNKSNISIIHVFES